MPPASWTAPFAVAMTTEGDVTGGAGARPASYSARASSTRLDQLRLAASIQPRGLSWAFRGRHHGGGGHPAERARRAGGERDGECTCTHGQGQRSDAPFESDGGELVE